MKLRRIISLLLLLVSLQWGSVMASAETVSLRFRINKSTVDASFKNNAAALQELEELSGRDDVQSVTVKAACSPDGPLSFNRVLARSRAQAVADHLQALNPSLKDIRIEVVEEDWSGLASYVRRSNKPWKDEALEILRQRGSNCKQLLQELWVGEAWEDMVKNYFSRLRKAEVVFAFTPQAEEVAASSPARVTFPRGVGSSIWPGFGKNKTALNEIQTLAHSSADTLYIRGCCSPDGSKQANRKLSEKRAQVLKAYLEGAGYKGVILIEPYVVRDRSAEVSLTSFQ